MNNKRPVSLSFFIVLFFLASACSGGGSSDSSVDDASTSDSVSPVGTKVNLTYQFQIQISDESGIHEPFVFPKSYTAPLYIESDGTVSLKAREFPKMVLRICPEGASQTDCDIEVDSSDEDLGSGLDLVMDLCGLNRPSSQCGATDGTVFEGTLEDDGSLAINAIAVRVRVFHLNEGPSGHTASSTATGFIADMPRITTSVRTGPDIVSGGMKASGQKVTDKEVTLIAGGVIPANMPELGSAAYIVVMEGTFDQAPLNLLD